MTKSRSSISRRNFLNVTAGAGAASVLTGTSFRAQQNGPVGANDRVRIGVIGTGTRGNMVAGFFLQHPDAQVTAACDVYKTRLDPSIERFTQAQKGVKVEAYEDYRRILDRKDIDAVLVATPDHWHCPMTVDACAAGKDVYVEKPLSNTIESAWTAVEAARKHNRIVQMGVQQRQGEAFREAAELVQQGALGKVTHVMLQFPGSYGQPPEPTSEPPAGLNWELFQGPAPRRPFKPSRLRWRAFFDYGGGLVTDWGVHLVDVAHWYLKADSRAPLLTSAAAQYVALNNPEKDQCPDAYTISWQYDDFVMTFTNAVVQDWEFGRQGTYFFGPQGSLLVHRGGFEIRPGRPQRGGRGGRGGQAGTPPPEPIQPRRRYFPENYQDDPDTIAHCREFLDCVKSRKRPSGDVEIGYHSTLPTLLAIHAIREGRTFKYDANAHKAVAVS
ncbi:MAG TPA: Gfo/Idh/MocA family oxidoreductase [Vicinamibacterales bacterium]|nr:Gfo/Idh/MocA family oxidoreductase [Vicinamibacterales bacterium]